MQTTDSVQMELASALPVFPYCLETKRLTIRCPQPGDGPELHAALMDSIERLKAWFPWAAEAELTPEESETTARYIRWRFLTGKEFQFFLFLQVRSLW